MRYIRRLRAEQLWRTLKETPNVCLVGEWPCFLQYAGAFPKNSAQPFATLYWHDYHSGVHHTLALCRIDIAEVVFEPDGYGVTVHLAKRVALLPSALALRFVAVIPANQATYHATKTVQCAHTKHGPLHYWLN